MSFANGDCGTARDCRISLLIHPKNKIKLNQICSCFLSDNSPYKALALLSTTDSLIHSHALVMSFPALITRGHAIYFQPMSPLGLRSNAYHLLDVATLINVSHIVWHWRAGFVYFSEQDQLRNPWKERAEKTFQIIFFVVIFCNFLPWIFIKSSGTMHVFLN